MKSKQIIALSLSALMIGSLVGCTPKEKTESTETSTTKTESTTTDSKTTDSESSEEVKTEITSSFDEINEENIKDKNSIIKLNESNEYYIFKTNTNIKKIDFYNAFIGEHYISFHKGDIIATANDVTPETELVINSFIPEVIPNIMAEITFEDGTVEDYVLEYNGRDGGISMMKQSVTANNLDSSSMLEYYGYQNIQVDLNNDGKEDKLYYDYGYQENETNPTLKINDKDFSSLLDDCFLYNASSSIILANIDESDDFVDIIISNDGDNDYDTFYILRYDGENLIKINKETQGMPGFSMHIEDGIIYSCKRADVLATMELEVKYKLENNELVEIKPESGIYNYNIYAEGGNKMTALEDLNVYTLMNDDSERIVLKEGETFISDKTDGEHWANIITSDGKEYWIYVDASDMKLYDQIEGLMFAG